MNYDEWKKLRAATGGGGGDRVMISPKEHHMLIGIISACKPFDHDINKSRFKKLSYWLSLEDKGELRFAEYEITLPLLRNYYFTTEELKSVAYDCGLDFKGITISKEYKEGKIEEQDIMCLHFEEFDSARVVKGDR